MYIHKYIYIHIRCKFYKYIYAYICVFFCNVHHFFRGIVFFSSPRCWFVWPIYLHLGSFGGFHVGKYTIQNEHLGHASLPKPTLSKPLGVPTYRRGQDAATLEAKRQRMARQIERRRQALIEMIRQWSRVEGGFVGLQPRSLQP